MVMSIAVTAVEEEKNRQFGLIVFSTEYTEHSKPKWQMAPNGQTPLLCF